MRNEDLKLLLALEPLWTISINSKEYVSCRPDEIELDDSSIRLGKFKRRIREIRWLRPSIVRIQAQSRARGSSDTLVLYPGSLLPPGVQIHRRRRQFARGLAEAVTRYFGTPVQRETVHSDKQHGIGIAYPRLMAGKRGIIAVDPDEPSVVVNGIIRAAIQWSAVLRRRIAVVLPADRHRTIAARLRAVPALQKSFDWLVWDGEQIAPLTEELVEPETHVYDYRIPNVQEEVARICSLAPDLLQPTIHIPGPAVSIRLRGLEVAHVAESGTTFPLGEPLQPLIEQLSRERRHGSRHALARAHEESWLESNLVRQIRSVLPVRENYIYPQVPSFAGEDRKVIDLLAITEAGRLTVIEVKASPDPELPFQALDYWMAVERHRKAGDFKMRGYFGGVDIRDEPALLVMVAPLLSFHRSFDRLVCFFPGNVPVLQIGINQDWKKEIKILRRKGSLG